MSSMSANAATSPSTSMPKASNPRAMSAPLTNAVNASNDVDAMDAPEGTTESDFSKWSA